jgi:hypothetical protein
VTQQQRKAKTETEAGPDEAEADDTRRVAALERRVEQLEAQLEALQDSVHRQATRHDKEIDALDERTRAPELTRALGKYSQERGL